MSFSSYAKILLTVNFFFFMLYKELLAKSLDPFKFKLTFGNSKLNLRFKGLPLTEDFSHHVWNPVPLKCCDVWNTSYIGLKHVRRSHTLGVKNKSLHKTVFIFNFVTTILETLFNIFNVFIQCFAYLGNRLLCSTFPLVGLNVLLIIRIVSQSLRTQLFRKDFYNGISSQWYFLPLTCWSTFIYFFMAIPKKLLLWSA